MQKIFNRTVKRIHRDRAAGLSAFSPVHDFFAEDLADRLSFFRRKFPRVLELGCHKGHLFKHIHEMGHTKCMDTYVMCDMAPKMAAAAHASLLPLIASSGLEVHSLCVDEEALPFLDSQFDLILTNLSFHWVNDLEQLFCDLRRILRPDGVLLGNMFGENTLIELNACFAHAEQELDGGVSPHTSPMVGGADVSALLLNSGFALPTVDVSRHVEHFQSGMKVMKFIQDIGENNALLSRRAFTPMATISSAAKLYDESFGTIPDSSSTEEFNVPATFEAVGFVGWRPHESQQQPLKRGTPGVNLQSILNSLDQSWNKKVE